MAGAGFGWLTRLQIVSCEVFADRSGRSRGCGVVGFATSEDAENAREQMNNVDIEGRQIFVREDREK